jgi:peroxiredoxin
LRDKIKEFERHGAQVMAVDPHESYRVRHMLRDVGVGPDAVAYPILADRANTVSATYGVAFQMGIHTECSNRPATFVIDRDGVIRFERRGTTFSDRSKPDELLKELDKLVDGKAP